jgi:exopolysaccharide biosynthesis polyprenyl glycosylphosphotransferase
LGESVIASRTSVLSSETLFLALADGMSTVAAVAVGLVVTLGASAAGALRSIPVHLAAPAILVPIAFGLCGLYAKPTTARDLRRKVFCFAVALTLVALFVATTHPGGVSGLALAVWSVGALAPAILLTRGLYWWISAGGHASPRAIVVGNVDQASRLVKLTARQPHAPFRLAGWVCTRRQLDRPPEALADLNVLGTVDSLEQAVSSTRADTILLGIPASKADAGLLRQLRALRLRGVAILDWIALHERLTREIPADEVDDAWLFSAAMSCSRTHIRWVKRTMDLAVCLLLLVPAALLLLPAAVAVRLSSPGPILFRQERLGLGGRAFWLFKLRTMRADAEKLTGPVWSTDNDPRITKAGRFLRKFRLDELPQIINVLRGDMSLVGPRPERPVLARQIGETVPLFPERLTVRPGITGWAQVMAPYASSVADSKRKLQFDLYYIKNLSFWLDLYIIAKTASTMVFGREREQGGLVAGRQLEKTTHAAAPPVQRADAPVSPEVMASSEPSGSFQISQAG